MSATRSGRAASFTSNERSKVSAAAGRREPVARACRVPRAAATRWAAPCSSSPTVMPRSGRLNYPRKAESGFDGPSFVSTLRDVCSPVGTARHSVVEGDVAWRWEVDYVSAKHHHPAAMPSRRQHPCDPPLR